MPNPYKGDGTVVYFTPQGGSRTKLSDESTTFNRGRQANSVPAATRGNPRFTLGGTPAYKATLEGLDIEGGAPAMELVEDTTGLLEWFWEGEDTGMRKESGTARVTNVDGNSELSSPVDWSTEFDITTEITKAEVV